MLKNGGKLLMYGPFAVDGVLQPQSNVDFDLSLKLNNPEWGIRDIRDLVSLSLAFLLVYAFSMIHWYSVKGKEQSFLL